MPVMERPLRVLFTGSRGWTETLTVAAVLHEITGGNLHGVTVIHGAADGLDGIVDRLCRRLGHTDVARFRAAWCGPCRATCRTGHRRVSPRGREYCPAAGNYRNQDMVDLQPQVVAGFQLDGSTGTRDCLTRAARTGAVIRLEERWTGRDDVRVTWTCRDPSTGLRVPYAPGSN